MTKKETNRHRMAALLEERRTWVRQVGRRERRVVALALAVFLGGLLLVMATADGLLPGHWALTFLLCLSLLIFLVAWRERLTHRRRRLSHSIEWLEEAQARLEDRWVQGQDDGREYAELDHPYAEDLDIFGEDSLFHRLNTTHTVLGRDALAAMLRGEGSNHSLRERQNAVMELAADLGWREELEGDLWDLRRQGDPTGTEGAHLDRKTRDLLSWGDAAAPPPEPWGRTALHVLLGAAATAALVAVLAGEVPWMTLIPFYLLNFVVLGRAEDIPVLVDRFEAVRETLGAWSSVIERLEAAPQQSPVLIAARAGLIQGTTRASAAVASLGRRVDWLSQRRNTFWALTFDVLWLADLHLRRALLAWKRLHGPNLRGWLETAGWMEAMAALAAYADAVPEDALPAEDLEGPLLQVRGLAHPLLPQTSRVGNDLDLQGPTSLLVITGSNMSGKSTFLRAAGLAVVMARLGLPVAATSFRFHPLRVATCMRVQDSIGRGSSLFQAEVARLRRCLDLAAGESTSLILLDEILAGTNSQERHAGTLAVLRDVVRRPAVTLIATHDLGLEVLAKEWPDRVALVHFRDHLEEGRMRFDYRLRPGLCPTTNALHIMRQAGFEVSEG